MEKIKIWFKKPLIEDEKENELYLKKTLKKKKYKVYEWEKKLSFLKEKEYNNLFEMISDIKDWWCISDNFIKIKQDVVDWSWGTIIGYTYKFISIE